MRRRTGFTLVEMLVAMALILFIMSILSAAFVAAMQSVSDFKAAGDLAEKERAVTTLLRRDLAADHWEGRKHLSRPDFWADGFGNLAPPREGFFRVYQGAPSLDEGFDVDGIHSYLTTTAALHFTAKLRGNDRGDFYEAVVPANTPFTDPLSVLSQTYPFERRYQDTANPPTYSSQWAEVAVFLVPTGETTDNGTPLFSLFRRQRLAVPDNGLVVDRTTGQPLPQASAYDAAGNNLYLEMSTNPAVPDANGNLYFNSPKDLTMPVRRLGMDPGSPAGVYGAAGRYPVMAEENSNYPTALNTNYRAADLLVTDVVSFDVRVLVDEPVDQLNGTFIQGGTDFEDLYQLTDPNSPTRPLDPRDQTGKTRIYYTLNNSQFPFNGPRVFDTWSSASDESATLSDGKTPLRYGDVPDPNNPGTYYANWSTPGSAWSIPILKDTAGVIVRIRAVQITLRVWDFKTKKSRQVTMVQAM
jgi:prepilin-type N-terminal cleavage/methylation domain-containing protein